MIAAIEIARLPMKLSLKDQSGASAMVFAVVAFVVVAVTALTITAGDAYSVRTKTQNALDAAVAELDRAWIRPLTADTVDDEWRA
jgi:Flp pilus assembly protein TadG